MRRLLLTLTLALTLGCSSTRPSYVRSNYDDVQDVCEQVTNVGRATLLVAAAVAVVVAVGAYYLVEAASEESKSYP
jgi:hypothetical protein